MFVAVVVARLLSPSDYGLAAIALVFSAFGMVFSDLALGAALIQRKTLTEDDRSTAFWMTIASGVVLMLVGFGLSGPVSDLYRQPATQPLFAALSVSFLISALGATQQALMFRELEFRKVEGLTIVGALASAPVAVVLAAAGYGPWAIIGQQMTVAAVTSALMWRASSWRPQLRFSRASLRDLWGFSGYLVGHRLLYYTQQNADNFIIGRFVGSAAVGAYAIAFNVMLAPASRIGAPLQRVLAPTFSRMQDEPARIADAWARVTRMIAALAVPALAGIIVVAPDFIRVLLGSEWDAAAPILQVLAWVGILQALQSINVDILMARDRTSVIFRFTAVFALAHLTAFAIGVHWGVVGVAAGYAISSTLIEPILTVLTARALGVSPMVFVRAVAGVFQAAIAMVAVLAVARPALVDAGVPAGPRLALLVLIGAVVYLPLCAWRAPELVRDVRSLLPGRRRTEIAPVPA
jgi:O-antigen/teichoic acid export membrane protein